MNRSTKLFLSTIALAGVGALASPAVLAGDAGTWPGHGAEFTSTLTRAEVRAEALRAQRAGELNYGEFSAARNDFLTRSAVVKSRAQVLAELVEARRLGLVGGRWHDNQPVEPSAEQARRIAEAGERAAPVRVTSR